MRLCIEISDDEARQIQIALHERVALCRSVPHTRDYWYEQQVQCGALLDRLDEIFGRQR